VRNAIIGLAATVLLAGCSGISTSTDWDTTVDFSSFGTYMWVDTGGDDVDNITNNRIRSSVDAALAANGLRKVDANPDLAVGFQVTTAERRSFNTVNAGWGGGYHWGGMGMGMGTSTTTEQVWQEGSLILGMFDADSKNLVWTGTATAELDQSRSPEERQKVIDDAVNKIMKDFPPGS
jgi:hypothetical protein